MKIICVNLHVALWLSGSVLNAGLRGLCVQASPEALCCTRQFIICLELVQPRKMRPYITDFLVGRKE